VKLYKTLINIPLLIQSKKQKEPGNSCFLAITYQKFTVGKGQYFKNNNSCLFIETNGQLYFKFIQFHQANAENHFIVLSQTIEIQYFAQRPQRICSITYKNWLM
jgi:hypothetical protein